MVYTREFSVLQTIFTLINVSKKGYLIIAKSKLLLKLDVPNYIIAVSRESTLETVTRFHNNMTGSGHEMC